MKEVHYQIPYISLSLIMERKCKSRFTVYRVSKKVFNSRTNIFCLTLKTFFTLNKAYDFKTSIVEICLKQSETYYFEVENSNFKSQANFADIQ